MMTTTRSTPRHIAIVVCALIAVLFPVPTHAQVDPRCFTKAECISERKNILTPLEDTLTAPTDQVAAEGFYTGADALGICGTIVQPGKEPEQMGFCLPAGQTVTQISFGGKKQFGHIGEFIQFIYQYGIMVASIVSVIVIIVGGLQWTMSGGNTSTIETAKKRIGGAIVGLILALLSYTILNTINPQLVNIRLPQAWLIKQARVQAQYCFELPSSTVGIAKFVEDNTHTTKEQKVAAASKIKNWDVRPQDATCGFEYLTAPGRETSCLGSYCEPGKVCVKEEDTKPSTCTRGVLSGNITMKGIFGESRAVDNDMLLIALCNDGSTIKSSGIDSRISGSTEFYVFTEKPRSNICSGSGGLVGFYIAAEINDTGTIGGDDDFHAIGRLRAGSSQCSVNLSKKVWEEEVGAANVNCSSDSPD
ncbi:MAG: hypothetical protein COU33_04835, partial [Candidatus Magasanikbacteria bacterium CG10_big_fil_rev_8_21_14_0_10_43_6]